MANNRKRSVNSAKRRCFVIMPFSTSDTCTEAEWTSIYEHLIKPAVCGSHLGYSCNRSDISTGSVIKGILTDLDTADLVVADLTDSNRNVFYELGVRQTLRRRLNQFFCFVMDLFRDCLCRIYPYCSFAFYRALVFTYPAAYTQLR